MIAAVYTGGLLMINVALCCNVHLLLLRCCCGYFTIMIHPTSGLDRMFPKFFCRSQVRLMIIFMQSSSCHRQ